MAENLGFEVTMESSFDEAIQQVTDALKAEGFGVLTRIDVDKTLREKIGVDFRPYTILGACNPRLAHRALAEEGRIGLLLPCNVTVEQTDTGRCLVRIGNPEVLLNVGDLSANPDLGDLAKDVGARLKKVAGALS